MMDKRATTAVRARRVTQLLADLGVMSCTSTKLKALSGGERKRVALAVQVNIKKTSYIYIIMKLNICMYFF